MDGIATQAGMMRRGGFDPDAAAYFAAISAAGSSISNNNKAAVNAFVVGCKADGIWTAIKASCILAGADTLAGALVPLVGPAPTNHNFVGGDYSRTTGLLGDGSTKSLSLVGVVGLTRTNMHAASWVSELPDATTDTLLQSTNGSLRIDWRDISRWRFWAGDGVDEISPPANGFVGVSRPDDTIKYRRNGGATTSQSKATTLSDPTTDYSIFSGGSGATDARVAFYSIGESLDLALLDARLTTYMASLT